MFLVAAGCALIRRCATSDKAQSKDPEGTAPLAIYHLHAKIVSRARGQSVVASAAYRAGQALHDERYGMTQDYTHKAGVAHSEILAPDNSPSWVYDRQQLWNRVEAGELRKDAQLAREFEIGLPIELTHYESVALMRDYITKQFVAKGMIADFAIHRDNPDNPHAHVLLTMRKATPHGFGPKERHWNAKADLLHARAAWAEHANEHLARAGHDIRIDHRTLEAQQIELIPGRKIGLSRERQTAAAADMSANASSSAAPKKLPPHVADRIAEQQRIAKENGELILADPSVVLHALAQQRATFTHHDIAKYLHTRTGDAAQFDAAYLKVTTSNELVTLGRDDWNRTRYTTRDMLAAEKSLLTRAAALAKRTGHAVAPHRQSLALRQTALSPDQRTAFDHITSARDIATIVGVAGSGKSTLLAVARQAWEAEGLTVKGAALSGIAAQNLQLASGIQSRTLASYEYAWTDGRDSLTRNDVLVIDEAGMIGTKQLERFLSAADKARAKVVLVGDPEQLQAIEAGGAFRGIVEEVGMVELTQVRRQKHDWARQATQALSTGKTTAALAAYEAHGAILAADTKIQARAHLLAAWSNDVPSSPVDSRLILAYTRDDVRELNAAAREIRKTRHELRQGETIATTRGDRELAPHDRIIFLRNEKSLGVKNGSLGTIEAIDHGVLQVRLDGKDGTSVIVDTRDYHDLDHGYATTVHKSQGSTVDRTYILASRYFDRHTSYVALSRHREAATLFYGQDEFAAGIGEGGTLDIAAARQKFAATLSRARPKELAHDYLERPTEESERGLHKSASESLSPTPSAHPPTPDEIQAAARERWLAYRAQATQVQENTPSLGRDRDISPNLGKDKGLEFPDDDLSL